MLMHVGCGFSLRETAWRAKQAGLAELSDVALLKRLRKCKDWFKGLCCDLFEQPKLPTQGQASQSLRLIDVTVIKEPGPTGNQWRIHYSFQWPSLQCDPFKLTPY
jgi:hypothetical protein